MVLLRLREQTYPGAKLIEDWPSWTLPILKWAKEQGAVAGFAHCGIGMVTDSTELPNYEIPPFDSIGTNEAIVDVTHGAVDFLSGCDTSPIGELNAWYHMLNCGFRLSMVGETDYPCMWRPPRHWSQLCPARSASDGGRPDYAAWVQALKQGRLYCGDGRSHFLDFKVNGHRGGEDDLALKTPETVHLEALVAARLEPEITAETTPKRVLPHWGWHLEWARMGKTRGVPVDCTISRNGPARFRVNGPTLHGLPAEPRFESSTRPFSLRQVFAL